MSMTVRRVAFTLAGIALTVVLWRAFEPQRGSLGIDSPAIAAVPAAGHEVLEIEIKEGRVASGAALLRAREGDEITIRIVSDRRDEAHLHGYDLQAQMGPGDPAVVAFTASRTGRFGLEAHRSHLELATLEIYPR
jgi:hypothetical protein